MSWSTLSTDEKISAIRDIYPQTAGSANAIAAGLTLHLKEEVSRNAVIGIFTRHADKLKGVRLSGHTPTPKKAKAPKLAPVVRPKKVNLAPPPKAVVPKPELVDVPKPKPFMTSLVDLACDECKWPVNDGGPYLFCGHLRHGDGPYCHYHHLVSVGPGTKSERMAVKVAA